MMLAPHTSPRAMVNRSRLRSATEEPLIVLDIPPPNMSERPPPLPLCNRTNRVSNSPLRTRSTCSPIFTAFTKVRPNLVRCQSGRTKHDPVAPSTTQGTEYLTALAQPPRLTVSRDGYLLRVRSQPAVRWSR